MAFIQRVLALGFIPVVALLGLQILSPTTFQSFHDAVQPYLSGTPLIHFFPEASLPRSQTPLIISSLSHYSHLEKISAVAQGLANQGYPITFISGKDAEEHVKSLHPNIKFVPSLVTDDTITEEDIKKVLQMPSDKDRALYLEKKVMGDNIPADHETNQVQFRNFRETYGDGKPLIFLHDQAAGGIYPVLLGAPGIRPDAVVSISIAPLTLDSNDTFPFRSGSRVPHTGPDAKEVHWKATQEDRQDPYVKELNDHVAGKLRGVGATRKDIPGLLQLMNLGGDYLLTLGVPEFEFARSDIRPNVRWFGALEKVGKIDAAEPKFPDWWGDIEKAKKDGKKIVAVSQGTVEINPQDIILPTMEVLKDNNDVLVIATFVVQEPEDVPGLVVPDNARVAKFVPYDQLLPLVDVLVSNGGYGGVQQALRAGIPMVVSGVGQDKATTNTIVEYTGVGINLKVPQPGAEKLGEAISKILKDPSYTKKAKALSKKFDEYDFAKVFDGTIQEIVRDWRQARSSH